jgi:anti-sigma-K factor RskA
MNDDTRRIAISVFAGEVALGTLSPEEEATVINRLGGDPDFLAERDAWERRLAPLASIVPRVAPSQGLWARIAAETVNSDSEPFGVLPTLLRDEAPVIDLEQAVAQRTRHLRARLRRWRVAATALTALAAGLAFFAVLAPRLTETPVPASSTASQRYVAVVTPSGDAPPLLVAVDLARGELSVQPVDLKPAAGKALELWAVPTGAKPVSLGLVTAADRRSIGSLQPSTWRDPGLLIAVSEEPAGGSPTGQPTGPVVYKGRLVRSP